MRKLGINGVGLIWIGSGFIVAAVRSSVVARMVRQPDTSGRDARACIRGSGAPVSARSPFSVSRGTAEAAAPLMPERQGNHGQKLIGYI